MMGQIDTPKMDVSPCVEKLPSAAKMGKAWWMRPGSYWISSLVPIIAGFSYPRYPQSRMANSRILPPLFMVIQPIPYGYGSKLGTPKLWMVNTKLDIHICGFYRSSILTHIHMTYMTILDPQPGPCQYTSAVTDPIAANFKELLGGRRSGVKRVKIGDSAGSLLGGFLVWFNMV